MSEATQKIELPVHDRSGQEVGKVPVDLDHLDTKARSRLIKDAVVMYHANKRVGTHDTKTRGEVTGANRKPWRQKGTGRARSGSRKSPIWRGGGVIFGPHPRDYRVTMNKKQRRRALRSALFSKFRDGEVRVIDQLEVEAPKTRAVATTLSSLGIQGSCLIGVVAPDRNLYLSGRNIRGVRVLPVSDFNAFDVLRAQTVLVTRDALEKMFAQFSADSAPGSPEKPAPEKPAPEKPAATEAGAPAADGGEGGGD